MAVRVRVAAQLAPVLAVGVGVGCACSGNVYVVGHTFGSLEGSSAGRMDVYVRKYSGAGVLQWTRQFGTSQEDRSRGIAVDSAGNVFVLGHTMGSLVGSNAGSNDVFVRKYSGAGVLQWTRQFGTAASDNGLAMSVDTAGAIYIVGHTAGGLAGPSAGGLDVFVRKYTGAGVHQWTRQFGTDRYEHGYAIGVDGSGNVVVGGDTNGPLEGTSAGSYDAFVRSYTTSGDLRWTRQFGTAGRETIRGLAATSAGVIYVTGETDGDLEGLSAGGEGQRGRGARPLSSLNRARLRGWPRPVSLCR